jgi:hypothetical protein
MVHRTAVAPILGVVLLAAAPVRAQPTTVVNKLGIDQDVRSGMKILLDELAGGNVLLPETLPLSTALDVVPQVQLRGDNVQANTPSGDYIQQFPGFRSFVHATQSEVSTAAAGRHIVLGYNNSAGIHVSPNPSGPGLIVDRAQLSGFAASDDGGQTWTNGFLPPSHGATQTFGDPSVGVDRHGNFYYANLAVGANGHATIQVNSSTDGGFTWSEGVIVAQDDASDKEWLAVGRDPVDGNQDNVYVTWTSFQSTACELRFGRSFDGGATWTAKTIFVPTVDPDPTHPQNCLTFSNPVVDDVTGTLYVPFLRFSNAAQDFIQLMKSDDAGDTFSFVSFNVSGAPSPTVIPVTQPGELTSCGVVGGVRNVRLTIHGTANAGPGAFGLPRYIHASRQVLQPAVAARNGVVYLAWSNSQSMVFGSSAGSDVWFVRSDDGGQSWQSPSIVNPLVGTDLHHVLPSLAIDTDPNDVHISYYTQHTDRSVDLDMANSHDRGNTFPEDRTVRVTSTSSFLPPTNVPLSNAPAFNATNYDRLVAVCYALGEYQSVAAANGSVYVGWGDDRNQITQPTNPLDPISGQTHPQEDVFFQKVKVQ